MKRNILLNYLIYFFIVNSVKINVYPKGKFFNLGEN